MTSYTLILQYEITNITIIINHQNHLRSGRSQNEMQGEKKYQLVIGLYSVLGLKLSAHKMLG